MQREAHVNYVTDKELIIKTFKKFKASKSVNNMFFLISNNLNIHFSIKMKVTDSYFIKIKVFKKSLNITKSISENQDETSSHLKK